MSAKIFPVTLILASLDGGGVQKAAIRLAQEFLKRNIHTTLIVVNAQGPLRKDVPKGCIFIDLKCHHTRQAFWPLAKYLISNKPDVMISAQTHLNILVILARILTRYPKILIVQEHITFNREIVTNRKMTERLRPQLIQYFYRFSNKIVAVSQDSANSIRKYARITEEINIIQNGLDLDEIRANAREPFIHPWLPKKDVKIVVGIGRLTYQKNFTNLLKAFALLDRKENCRLIIIGDGPELSRLKVISSELGIQNVVDFTGFVDNPFPFLARADLFVLPSLWEGFANVVIEALACGTPIVATNCPGGPADILMGKPFAKIVPINDQTALAGAITEMLAVSHEKVQIMDFAENFGIQKIAQQYIDLVNEVQQQVL